LNGAPHEMMWPVFSLVEHKGNDLRRFVQPHSEADKTNWRWYSYFLI
jgi:hypothetical protein